MRILVLLTLTGLVVGLTVDRDCDGRVNGVYATSPCSNDFNHCYNGQVIIKSCPKGLVFNPDSSQCDFDSNVAGCAAREEVSCKNRKDGTYTIGCSSSFFFCSNGIIHQSNCQNGLFYDVDRKTCDHKFRVRACGGHPEVEREPVTRPPLVVPTYAPQDLKSYARIRGYGPVSADPALSCMSKPDGAHPLGSCVQQYVVCDKGISQLAECPSGQVYSSLRKCMSPEDVTECKSAAAPPSGAAVAFDCTTREDGNYGIGCTEEFIYCSGGIAQSMKCPSSLVFNEAKGYCDYPEACSTSGRAPKPTPAPRSAADVPKSVSSSFCTLRKDGYYSDGCNTDFVLCENGVATSMKCPSSLVFNEKKGYCDYPEDCTSGSSMDQPKPPVQAAPSSPAISCVGRSDGYYSNGCSSSFVHCTEGVATSMNCPPTLVFNEKKGHCDYAEECLAQSAPVVTAPTVSMQPTHPPAYAQPPSPSVNCVGKKDGFYSNGCTQDFVFCNEGVATAMKCPPSLVFNQKKGECDYIENCSSKSPAVPPIIPMQPAPAQAPPMSSLPDCTGKAEGYYSNGCTPVYVHCKEGVATSMTCPTSLVYNEKKGYCDYPEDCLAQSVPAVTPPTISMRPTHPPPYAPPTSSVVNCVGKKDGFYSNGCTHDFVFCNEGVATAMKCPPSLVFNQKKGECDYIENCSSESPAVHPIIPMQPVPAQAPPMSSLPDCTGKAEGYYSNGCTPVYVHCKEGVATSMTCPASLVYNGKKGYCDYPEDCLAQSVPAVTSPTISMQPTHPPPYAQPTSSALDCRGKSDGYYSNGCSTDFVFCSEGVSTSMKCPPSLVFNEKKGQCDYVENCTTDVPPELPPPSKPVPPQPAPSPVYAPPTPSTTLDCFGKKDGHYSNGCTADFVFCSQGVATPMKCPPSLVFNSKKGYCDFMENCSAGAVPVMPPTTVVPTPAPALAPPTPSRIDCATKKDGYYSIGCSSEFVLCQEGVATTMTCPASLVFNQKTGHCDYPETCIASSVPAAPPPTSVVPPTPAPSYAPPTPSYVDCVGKKDGFYSNGCTHDFVYCSEGTSTPMKCPQSLVFNKQKGECDYVENCVSDVPPVMPPPSVVVPPQPAQAPVPAPPPAPVPPPPAKHMDCTGKKDGYYSEGCSPDFFFCTEGVATAMKCPPSLIFNAMKGHCDYVENCASQAPVVAPPPASVPPAQAPASVDCAAKKDGYYSIGCSSEFVLCKEGVATTMTCPSSLVFNEKKGYCDYPEDCIAVTAPIAPPPASVVKPVPAPSYAPPTPSYVDCVGKKDGFYSNGCSQDFVYCSEGASTPMKCPQSLVFNEKKGECDYVENCVSNVPPVMPPPSVVPPQPAQAPVPAPPPPSKHMDCAGKKDGYYSEGCSPDFFFCTEGVATAMKCPPSLVFNAAKGHCDYVENCASQAPPVMPPPAGPKPPVPPPVLPPPTSHVNCVGKKEGFYSNGCTPDFVHCSEGTTTSMKCPPSLVFNEKKGQCDYVENCPPSSPSVMPPPPAVLPPPQPARPQPAPPPVYAPPTPSKHMDCTGKKDGYYSEGCSPDFFFCTEGVATAMKCPPSLVFNAVKGHCDYVENCASQAPPVMPPPAGPKPPVPPPVFSPPTSSVNCIGKKEGFYSNGCTPDFVYCSEGVSTPMKCPPSLVFDEKKGQCDYIETCSSGVPPMVPPPPVVLPPQHVQPPVYAPPAPSKHMDCTGKKDGYYSEGCSHDFFFCTEGVATAMKCPPSLVFNAAKGHCDYVENCASQAPPVMPPPTGPKPQVTPMFSPPTSHVDCVGKKEGFYSNGCTPDFVHCSEGTTTPMKCPPTLVFNQMKGQCDYVENCPASSPSVMPPPPAVLPPPQPVPPPVYAPPAPSKFMDCTGKKDGYYSKGCSPDFFFCTEGVAAAMKCPPSLVFNEKKGQCDYVENCTPGIPPVMPPPPAVLPPPQPVSPPVYAPPAPSKFMDCTGKKDGYYSEGCSPDFFFCVEGVATAMKCPPSLVFDAVKGYCDYVENCASQAPSVMPHPTGPKPQVPPPVFSPPTSPVDCVGKKQGYYSNGCTADFVYCSEGTSTPMKCPPSLVFNEKKGQCDYVENCSSGTPPVMPPASPVLPPQPAQPPVYAPPTATKHMDCTGKKDGYYSEGCTSDFFFCIEGVATAMKCPPSLVFNAAKGQCDYAENCSSAAAPSPIPVPPPYGQPPAALSPPSTSAVDCKGRPNGYYSNGCSPDFVFCNEGVATLMKCPPSLVFVEKKGYCDYPENCDGPIVPSPSVSLPPQPSQPPALSPPSSTSQIDCTGLNNGYYSNGCSSDFVYCTEGIATIMKCPASLVFNEKKGYCDYPENCSSGPVAPAPSGPAPQKPTKAPALSPPSSSSQVDCIGRQNGYYSNGCSQDFVYCTDGSATLMKCPSSLVFNEKMGYCDYPDMCSMGGEANTSHTVAPEPAKKPGLSFVCPKPDGVFSLGCAFEFVVCSHGSAQVMLCPGELVFNAVQGFCDHKVNCNEKEQGKPAVVTPAPSGTTGYNPPPAITSDCLNLPDGKFGSQCGSTFVVCSNGVSYTMNCPADLVFDAKKSLCVYPDECDGKPISLPSFDATTPSYPAKDSRTDCVGKPDGLHSLGCIAEFLQCVDGNAYSLYCPAGLVFVEQVGVCDVPSACSHKPKPENVTAPLPYEPAPSHGGEVGAECSVVGYFSHFCTAEFFNCVHGKTFVGKCPAGLVFNPKKVCCDYVENCVVGDQPPPKPSAAQPVPSTEVNKDNFCKNRPDGIVDDEDCQPQFTTCLSGIAFVTKCPDGLVYSVTEKLCNYPEACGSKPADAPVTVAPVTSPAPAEVHYQSTSVGTGICAGKDVGPLNTMDCRASFSFCVYGALYSTNCPAGLLFSFMSHRCEWATMCGQVPAATTTPAPLPYPTTAAPVVTYPSHDVPTYPSHDVPVVTGYDCTNLPDGNYPLGECVGRFVMCSNGHAYVQFCPSGLMYNAAKGLCDYECSGLPATTPGFEPPVPQVECVMSAPMGRCLSMFKRCKDGKYVQAHCPGLSLFHETLLMCVYDIPECRPSTTTSYPPSYTPPPYYPPTQPPYYPPAQPPYYPPAAQPPYQPQPMPMPYPMPFMPMQFPHAQYGRDYVNKGLINFQARSILSGDRRLPVWDIFDGYINPYLRPGIHRIFVPKYRRHPRPHCDDRYDHCDDPEDMGPHGGDPDFDVYRLFENDARNPELPVPIEVITKPAPAPFNVEHADGNNEEAVHAHEEAPNHELEEHMAEVVAEEHPEEHHAEDVGAEDNHHQPLEDYGDEDDVGGPAMGMRGGIHKHDKMDEVVEGSGQEEVSRRRRRYVSMPQTSQQPSSSAPEFSQCTASNSPGLVPLGFCRQDFIFCTGVGAGVMAACPVGDLMDENEKCVSSQFCGKGPQQDPIVYAPPPTTPPRFTPAPPPVPVTVPSVPLYSAAHAVPTTTTTSPPQPVVYPYPTPPPYPTRPSVPAPAPVQQTSPAVDCSTDMDYALDCSGNFVKCANGVAYTMKCPQGLVFDQAKHYCDYPENVVGCGGAAQGQAPVLPQPKPYPTHIEERPLVAKPVKPVKPMKPMKPVKPTPVNEIPAHKAPKKDLCSAFPDGLHSTGCTASFVICYQFHIQTSMNCPIGTWFDELRGVCDFKEKIAACGGSFDEPLTTAPQPVVVRTTTPPAPASDSSCPSSPKAVGRCSSKFIVCSNGVQNEFDCAKPLVFNPVSAACDFREFIPECEQFQGSDVPQVTTTTTQATTTTTAAPTCVYSKERPAFALDYCARVYGVCSHLGVLQRDECAFGFLFDAYLITCVPSEECGQARLKEYISKVTFAPPAAAAQVSETTSKYAPRKDTRCKSSAEGSKKPLGRCRSTYIKCIAGEVVIEPCATTAEVFSAAVGACVMRINAPECHQGPPRFPTYPSSPSVSNDPTTFCKSRSDGLYRNPTDCAGILQCFGGDVFEYPACSPGLVFNEATGKCDYREAVPECRLPADDAQVVSGCRGASHGDFVPHESDCQQFYRCVWDRLERMHCPSGTVFNPQLSVCDWPDNVPQCSGQVEPLPLSSHDSTQTQSKPY